MDKLDYPVEVKLVSITLGGGEGVIEYAGRLCWDTTDKTGSTPDRIQKWIEIGHESMIEHASATFHIRASRVLTHELVRHRIASYSQRSQRYVKEDEPRYIEPPDILDDSAARPKDPAFPLGISPHYIFQGAMRDAWKYYQDLLEEGVKPELARYVLPNACETQIVCTWNFREIRHIIKLRTSKRALPEMQAVAGRIRDIMKEQAPQVFADL